MDETLKEKLDRCKDPENVKDLIDGIRKLVPNVDVIEGIQEYYPNWIKKVIIDYSPDYPHFKRNWEKICSELKDTKPRNIVLVELVYEDIVINTSNGYSLDNYNLLIAACDILTYNGYCVRREAEFIPCEICGLAIPSEPVYDFIKRQKIIKYPRKWSKTCSGCVI